MAFSIDLPVLAALVVGMALSVFSLWFFNREQPPKTVLDGTTWFNFPLTKKIVINHNTAMSVALLLSLPWIPFRC